MSEINKKNSKTVINFLTSNAFSLIIYAAILCTIAAKLFQAIRTNHINEYYLWILFDFAFLLSLEVILSILCFSYRRKSIIRTAMIIAAIACTWSIINAAWIIRTGSQIVPSVLLPLFRDSLIALAMIGTNLIKMPISATLLLGPSAIALTFFCYCLSKPASSNYSKNFHYKKICISLILIITSSTIGLSKTNSTSSIMTINMRQNSQLMALVKPFQSRKTNIAKKDFKIAKRTIPYCDQITFNPNPDIKNHNIVIIILEGVQYQQTSLFNLENKTTPFLVTLAGNGMEFANTRTSFTHTTKAIFGILTGLCPSSSQDLIEAVPQPKHFLSLTTILRKSLSFKTAFFQSAKGSFEARPGLVHNLGFDKFFTRDNFENTDSFIGYLGCDEFEMIEPIMKWIQSDEKPFLLTVLCSITHDPYIVPQWFDEPMKTPIDRYRQTIRYTDKFIGALHDRLDKSGLTENTIFIVVGDHGEAFGEHGILGHEQIGFEEGLRIPWIISAPSLISKPAKIDKPVTNADLTPTILSLMNFQIKQFNFDGLNAINAPEDRKLFFSGWLPESPAGYIHKNKKFVYLPNNKMLTAYDLNNDPNETKILELTDPQAGKIINEIVSWRKKTITKMQQKQSGETILFDNWHCSWKNRLAEADFEEKDK